MQCSSGPCIDLWSSFRCCILYLISMWLNVVPSLNQCALSKPTRERAGGRAGGQVDKLGPAHLDQRVFVANFVRQRGRWAARGDQGSGARPTPDTGRFQCANDPRARLIPIHVLTAHGRYPLAADPRYPARGLPRARPSPRAALPARVAPRARPSPRGPSHVRPFPRAAFPARPSPRAALPARPSPRFPPRSALPARPSPRGRSPCAALRSRSRRRAGRALREERVRTPSRGQRGQQKAGGGERAARSGAQGCVRTAAARKQHGSARQGRRSGRASCKAVPPGGGARAALRPGGRGSAAAARLSVRRVYQSRAHRFTASNTAALLA